MADMDFLLKGTIALFLILITSRACGALALKIKQPRVVGEMVAGILLGPSLFGLLFGDLQQSIFTPQVNSVLSFLSNLGLAFYMFTVGMELDYKLFSKDNVKKAGFLAMSGIITPFVLAVITAASLYHQLSLKSVPITTFALFMAGALSLTAFPMLARILQERKLTKTKLGSLTIIAASIDDVSAWILLALINALAQSNSLIGGLKTAMFGVLFAMICLLVIRPILNKYITTLENKGEITEGTLALVIMLILGATWYTDYVGIYSVFGGFILGLAMPRTPLFQKYISDNLINITVVFLVPIFFTNSGLKTDFSNILNIKLMIPCILILLASFLGKYGGATIAMKKMGFSWRESSAIGGLMNARGLMLLIFINLGISYNLISPELFSILVLMAVISTAAAMPIYNASLPNYYEAKIKKDALVSSKAS
ncbi:cation:proton antiporter [Bacillus cereus]|uniref:Transporter n=1 Tax=Bacillus cereus TaxID=1396 RepID=A0A9X6UJX4_BACCE|nr:cation:proton antiporter [Bacillus cereus]PEQ83429.1 transporter [Bacillus cereus]